MRPTTSLPTSPTRDQGARRCDGLRARRALLRSGHGGSALRRERLNGFSARVGKPHDRILIGVFVRVFSRVDLKRLRKSRKNIARPNRARQFVYRPVVERGVSVLCRVPALFERRTAVWRSVGSHRFSVVSVLADDMFYGGHDVERPPRKGNEYSENSDRVADMVGTESFSTKFYAKISLKSIYFSTEMV